MVRVTQRKIRRAYDAPTGIVCKLCGQTHTDMAHCAPTLLDASGAVTLATLQERGPP